MKKFIWPALCALVLFFLYQGTGAQIQKLLLPEFAVASLFFMLSVFFWGFAWAYLVGGKKPLTLFFINIKALAGILGPFGLGVDALRAVFAGKHKFPPELMLSTSFIVKFFKFLVIFLLLIFAILILFMKSNSSETLVVFIVSLCLAGVGMATVWAMRSRKTAMLGHRLLRRLFIFKFQDNLNKRFLELSPNKVFTVLLLLAISTVFEILAVMYCFLAVGQALPFDRIIVFAAIANSLAFLTFTPQGLGFVEGGGFLVLQSGFFSLGTPVIGSFLIVWNIIRIWIPSLAGAIASALDA